MKSPLVNIAITLGLLASASVLAQQTAETPVDLEDVDAYQPLEDYSQSASLAAPASLALVAINEPDIFSGLPVVDANGADIGQVENLGRRKLDDALHAVVATTEGEQRAVLLDALALDAVALWAAENPSTFEPFVPAQFEPVTQYQSGHSAWGSLRQPGEASAADEVHPAPLPGPVVNPIEAFEQELADEAAQHTSTGRAQVPVVTENDQVYETSNSPVALLALNQSAALDGVQLLSAEGEVLGIIADIAKNIGNQELYAVLLPIDAAEPSAVKLEALTIGRLLFEPGAAGFLVQAYQPDDFEMLNR